MEKSFNYHHLPKDNADVLLVDHQAGLLSLVQDFSPGESKNNVPALASPAKHFEWPAILNTLFEGDPSCWSCRGCCPMRHFSLRPNQRLGQ